MERVAHNLSVTVALCGLMEFSFFVTLLATFGAFNGGEPTTTPLALQAYCVLALVVTPVVAFRAWQMRAVARDNGVAQLKSMRVGLWASIAFFLSGVLPGMAMRVASQLLDTIEA